MFTPTRQAPTSGELLDIIKNIRPPANEHDTVKVMIRYKRGARFDVVREDPRSIGFTILLVPFARTSDDGEKALCWTYTGLVCLA